MLFEDLYLQHLMQTKKQTSKEYFTSLTVIHAALMTGPILFGLVAFYLNASGQFTGDADNLEVFQIIVPIIVVGGFIGSSLVSNSRLNVIRQKADLRDKLGDYRATLVVKYALLEGPALFALVCYILTASYLFLGLAGLMILALFIQRPTKFKTANDLRLDRKDRELIENPEAVVAEVKQ